MSSLTVESKSQSERKLGEIVDLLGVGFFVNTIQGRAARIRQFPGNGFVCQQHELLYDAVGNISFRRQDINYFAAFVKTDICFGQIEVDRAPAIPRLNENPAQLFHSFKKGYQVLIS